jgi:cyanophycinase
MGPRRFRILNEADGSGDDPSYVALAASMTAFFAGGDQFRYAVDDPPDGSDGAVPAVIRSGLAGAPVAVPAPHADLRRPDMITGGLSYYGVRDGSQPLFDSAAPRYWPPAGSTLHLRPGRHHFDAAGTGGRSGCRHTGRPGVRGWETPR